MLPTFVIGKMELRVGIIGVILVSQGLMMHRGVFVLFGCLLAVRSNNNVKEGDLEI